MLLFQFKVTEPIKTNSLFIWIGQFMCAKLHKSSGILFEA